MGEPVVTVMRRSLLATLLAAVLVVAVVAPVTAGAAKGGKASVHKPPYEKGNQGGDSWNYIEADPKAGTVQVLRAFPGVSPIVGCAPEPAAGWATLTLKHGVKSPANKVKVKFDAVLDPYAWVYAVVWDGKHNSLGLEKFQGPFAGSRSLTVDLFRKARRGSEITIEFGAQVGDACPMLSGADVSFSAIKIQ